MDDKFFQVYLYKQSITDDTTTTRHTLDLGTGLKCPMECYITIINTDGANIMLCNIGVNYNNVDYLAAVFTDAAGGGNLTVPRKVIVPSGGQLFFTLTGAVAGQKANVSIIAVPYVP
jgi:hypothetical protein